MDTSPELIAEAERMWGKQAQGVINELLHDR